MNTTAKNVLKIVCVMAGAGLSMLGNVIGTGKKDDDSDNKAAKK